MAEKHEIPKFMPTTSSNAGEVWRKWRNEFLNYLVAKDLEDVSEKRKVALFLMLGGDCLKAKFDSLKIQQEAAATTLKLVIDKFDESYKLNTNEVFASFSFWNPNLKQEPDESFESFYKRVRDASVDCNFGESLSRNLRDKLVMGINNAALRERLLREKNLDETTVASQCEISEQSQLHSKTMSEGAQVAVEALRTSINRRPRNCFNCGGKHQAKSCPAFGKRCNKCGKLNHFESVCRSSFNERQVHEVYETPVTALSRVHIAEIQICNINLQNDSTDWLVDAEFNQCAIVNCKIDTGAQANVMSREKFHLLPRKPVLDATNVILRAFGGHSIDVIGQCIIPVKANNILSNQRFLITKVNTKTILGLQASKDLGFINNVSAIHATTPESIIEEFKDVFEGAGSLKPARIVLSKNAVPHISQMRKLPIAIEPQVKQELDKMVSEGIITKIEEPTDWVNNFHIINKDNKIRIVLDPRPLNKFIKRPHFHIPTIDELLLKLNGCKVFSMFDAKRAFWQQPIDDESSLLTTFITPYGRYRYLKMPYGLVNAPENFQSTMHQIFEDIPNVEPYLDDLILGSKNFEDHLVLLRKVLETARENNLKLNPEKIQLAKSEVTYLGHKISAEGISPVPSKIEAVLQYPTPTNKEELHRFLSMYRYYNKFVENASHKSYYLRRLLQKKTEWVWDSQCDQCFESLKKDLIDAPILQVFDPLKPTTLSVDASGYGLGAVLLQNNKPVAFASASLNSTQQKYAQIEKELLAVSFGLHHFHFYTFGRKIVVENDHKPLVGLKEKPFESISPRLQRLLYKTLSYDYDIKYVPGKELITADALSRAPIPKSEYLFENSNQNPQLSLNILTTATVLRWKELQQATLDDCKLQNIINYMSNGWPQSTKNMSATEKAFSNFKDELYMCEGLICRGNRLVVPDKCVSKILEILHDGHNGMFATKNQAKEFFYWLNMNADIEKIVERCDLCQRFQKSNQYEPMIERPITVRPWQRISADFFQEGGKHYLLFVDYFSKYIEIIEMTNSTNVDNVIEIFKNIYCHHGFPEEVITDRGPPFNSRKFEKYHNDHDIFFNPSTPRYPRSNGMIERQVQTIKLSIRKALSEGKDKYDVMLCHNSTSRNGLKSPAELLFGRKLKTKLTVHPEHLKPNYPIEDTIQQLKKNQQAQKSYNDVHTKTLCDLNEGNLVWFQHYKSSPWFKGKITKVDNNNRSYTILAENGRLYIRNRVFIRPNKASTSFHVVPEPSAEDYYPVIIAKAAVVQNNNNNNVQQNFEDPVLPPIVPEPEEVEPELDFYSQDESEPEDLAVDIQQNNMLPGSQDDIPQLEPRRSGRKIVLPKRLEGFDLSNLID